MSIKEQVLARSMPPWGAVKGFGSLMPDDALSQEEMMIIASWVIGGAPNGDPALLPKAIPSKPRPPVTATQDVLTVTNNAVVQSTLTVTGIRPLPSTIVVSARIVAFLPDGRIEPLVWLYQFDPKWNRVFQFRKPIALPAGTRVESSASLRFALESEPKVLSRVQ